jgi:hypothetical protein
MKKSVVCVIFDSIQNSVFKSQVLEPLINNYTEHNITVVSFERYIPSAEIIKALEQEYTQVKFILYKRLPIITELSLIGPLIKLKKHLKNLPEYILVARGPLAGLISLRIYNKLYCTKLIIQARGLLAAEYSYSTQDSKKLKKLWHLFRFHDLLSLEKKAYKLNKIKTNNNIKIEAVSNALAEYLETIFNTPRELITIAQHDIPQVIESAQINRWRKETRSELNISESAIVYCYNGSAKAWQCPKQVIEFFKLQESQDKFLLILTQDANIFSNLLKEAQLESNLYLIKSVEHEQIYKYLAACDIGLIFREAHLLNWISRPTKVLEYKSVGLKIIHNNTVKCLINPT